MPAAVAIPLIVGAAQTAGAAYSAKKGAAAAKGAAAQQTAASNTALQTLNSIYQQQTAGQQPFVNAGLGALSTLGVLGSTPKPTFNPNGPPASWTGFTAPRGTGNSLGRGVTGPMATGARPMGPLATMGAAPVSGPNGAGPGGAIPVGGGYPSGAPPTGGAMPAGVKPAGAPGATVKMRAPDGSVRDVPSGLVAQYQAKGAVQV